MDPKKMNQEQLDIYSDYNNPNNQTNINDWANAHNPNNPNKISTIPTPREEELSDEELFRSIDDACGAPSGFYD